MPAFPRVPQKPVGRPLGRRRQNRHPRPANQVRSPTAGTVGTSTYMCTRVFGRSKAAPACTRSPSKSSTSPRFSSSRRGRRRRAP